MTAIRTLSPGAQLIARERTRQILGEKWSAAHDDTHNEFELSQAAIAYIQFARGQGNVFDWWPWDTKFWKPAANDPIRNLVKAGALIAAEIDRLQRLEEAK